MTGLTFFSLNGIQKEARMGDTRYARDLGLLLASNVVPLAAEGHDRELARVTEEFWRTSRSLRYIFYADPEGVIYLGIPVSKVDGGNDLLLSRRLELPADLQQRPQNPLIRQHPNRNKNRHRYIPCEGSAGKHRFIWVYAKGHYPQVAVASQHRHKHIGYQTIWG